MPPPSDAPPPPPPADGAPDGLIDAPPDAPASAPAPGAAPPARSASTPLRRWLARFGVAGFAFFLVKGLLWLIVPAIVVAGC